MGGRVCELMAMILNIVNVPTSCSHSKIIQRQDTDKKGWHPRVHSPIGKESTTNQKNP